MLKKAAEKQREAYQSKLDAQARKLNRELGQLSDSLEENLKTLRTLFDRDDTFIARRMQNVYDEGIWGYVLYCGGMIDNLLVGQTIIEPFNRGEFQRGRRKVCEVVTADMLESHRPELTGEISQLVESITYGDTVLLLPGSREAVVMSTQGFSVRGINEPDGEKIISGPREGFNESLIGNLTMLHRKLRTHELKMEYQSQGRLSHTSVALCYLDSVVNQGVLKELKERLARIDIDAVLDSNYIAELVRDKRYSPFRDIGATERPDIVAAKLLEGRVAILVDGSPVVLTAPYLFIENFQSNEDYYQNYYFASFSRILRMLGMFITMFTTGLYVCMTSFHYEILPTPLLLNITSEAQNVPFPSVVEAFMMLIVFDILRETGIRMPTSGGQALSIVGALVIGQSAVEARIVSPQMIIVIAITGITNLLIPKLSTASIVVRPLVLVAAGCFGLFGLTLAAMAVLTHVLNLTSLGVSQVGRYGENVDKPAQDRFMREPWWKMQTRPARLSRNHTRQRVEEPLGEASHEEA